MENIPFKDVLSVTFSPNGTMVLHGNSALTVGNTISQTKWENDCRFLSHRTADNMQHLTLLDANVTVAPTLVTEFLLKNGWTFIVGHYLTEDYKYVYRFAR